MIKKGCKLKAIVAILKNEPTIFNCEIHGDVNIVGGSINSYNNTWHGRAKINGIPIEEFSGCVNSYI